jgi:hypothetical protein
MTALKSLNFTALQKPSTNPTLDRRARPRMKSLPVLDVSPTRGGKYQINPL